jgi:hypothetical protein
VDLWDLTKLLLRRWYFALPMLLATLVLVYAAAQTVDPDYSAKGYLQMIPPPGPDAPEDPNAKPRPRNPWFDLGYEALGTAAVLKVTEKAALERLDAIGLTDEVTVLVREDSPLFEIEAIGSSPAQATATVREIIRQITAGIAESQKQYGVFPEDTITTLTLNDGGNVEVVTAKKKRVLIVAAGVGLLLTAAATIALDALARRRARPPGHVVDPDLALPGGPPPGPSLAPSGLPLAAAPTRPAPGPLSQRPAGTSISVMPASGPGTGFGVDFGPAAQRRAGGGGRPSADSRPAGGSLFESGAAQSARPAPADVPDPLLSLPPATLALGWPPEQPRLGGDDPVVTTRPPGESGPASPGRSEAADLDDDSPDATIVLPLAYLSKRDDRNTKN